MRVLARWSPVLAALMLTAPAAAQQPQAPTPYVNELPGAGRPVDIPATTARRQRLMDRLGDAVILVPAAAERDVNEHAQDSDFRQDNTFFYLTMLETPVSWLVMNARANGADDAVLLLPDRNPQVERWTGVKLGLGEDAVRITGFATVLSTRALDSVLTVALDRSVPVYVPFESWSRGDRVIARLRADSARVALRNLRPAVDSMRIIKDAQEIAMLRRAARISAEAHADLMRQARPGMWEYQLEAILEAGFRGRGADRVGYPSIVGTGFNTTTLHYAANRAQSRPGELVLVDAAAEYAQYTADVTRTFPVGGSFTPRQRAIYDLVLGAQQAALDSVRPGVTLGELNRIARAYLRQHSGDLCAPLTCDGYMIHGLSHHIGMSVHDVGPGGMPLAPGMVFTIEPGVYIPAESLGVRIEDDVLVTETGYELLSGAAPRRADDVERLMQGRQARAAGTR
jgi:Xaa-Pro aminopeptidase